MIGIGALVFIFAIVHAVTSPWMWFHENIRKPISSCLDKMTSDLCCTDETILRKTGQRIGYQIALLAYDLPLCRKEILEHAISFIARFDDGNFIALICWEQRKDEAIVRAAVDAALARVGYIEDVYPTQKPITELLRKFVYDKTMTVQDVMYHFMRERERASA